MGEGQRTYYKTRKDFGDTSDPGSMAARAESYTQWMTERNYSLLSVRQKSHHLRRFLEWCEMRGVARPEEITRPILERYQRDLFNYRRPNGKRVTFRTQRGHLVSIQVFFRWLCRTNVLTSNPASDLELPKKEQRLPTGILSSSEMETVLNQTDIRDVYGLRDRAVMETLYSTGVRRSELVGIKLKDIDMEAGTVFVNQGKGKKDRVVPIGDRALTWIEKYLSESRAVLSTELKEEALFLNNKGKTLTPGGLGNIVKAYLKSAAIERGSTCHLFRHTMATLMLENGADIRYIQEILGHAKLESTKIYTQVSIQKLKEIHNATHPAKLKRKERGTNPDDV
jgi:integrase/recombinase XerD